MTILLAVAFGAAIGLLLGLIGGGGSILTVPVLVYLLGQDVHEATATSLAIVGATAIAGAVPHARAGRVALGTALLFGGAGIGGAFAGVALNRLVSGPVLLVLFGLLMLLVAARMLRGRPGPIDADAPVGRWPVAVASGLVVGVMTGFFGVGGGFLIVPALVLVLGYPMRMAIGTSLVIIAINSAAGLLAQVGSGTVDLSLAALFIAGGLAGAAAGGRLADRVDDRRLARGFALFIVAVAVFLIGANAGPALGG